MGRKLFVGNLPFTTDEHRLEEVFAAIGPVDSVNIVRDQMTGRARGFAFVEMQTDEAAHGIAGLCADSEPILDAFGIQLDLCGLLERIVRPHQFAYTAITRPRSFNDYYTVKRSLLLANP